MLEWQLRKELIDSLRLGVLLPMTSDIPNLHKNIRAVDIVPVHLGDALDISYCASFSDQPLWKDLAECAISVDAQDYLIKLASLLPVH